MIFLFLVGLIVGTTVIDLGNKQTIEAMVIDTFIDDGNTFFVLENTSTNVRFACENEDSLWYWKFNSNDFVFDIETGKTYQFLLVGYRIPFLSAFPNIIAY